MTVLKIEQDNKYLKNVESVFFKESNFFNEYTNKDLKPKDDDQRENSSEFIFIKNNLSNSSTIQRLNCNSNIRETNKKQTENHDSMSKK